MPALALDPSALRRRLRQRRRLACASRRRVASVGAPVPPVGEAAISFGLGDPKRPPLVKVAPSLDFLLL